MKIHEFQFGQYLRLTIVCSTLFTFSGHVLAQTQNDTLLIQQTILDYLEGLENNDTIRVERAFHTDLAKRVIQKDKNGILT